MSEEVQAPVEETQPPAPKAKKSKPVPRKPGDPLKDGDHIIFTANYPSYNPFASLKYEPGSQYEVVISDDSWYVRRLLETGTLRELDAFSTSD